MEQCVQSSCATKKSEVRKPWTDKDMFENSDLTWDPEQEIKVMTWQLNIALRAIEEHEVNLLKWRFKFLLSTLAMEKTGA